MVKAPSDKITLADLTLPADAPLSEILSLLKTHGAVVLKKLHSKEVTDQLLSDIAPYLKQENPWREGHDFFPPTTRRVTGLLTKSSTFVDKVLLNDTFQAIADDMLTVTSKMGIDEKDGKIVPRWVTSKPQINNTFVFEIHPGAKAQALHRDDYNFHNILDDADEWSVERECGILFFSALSRVTPENGGTLFVPGSHLWAEERYPTYDQALSADLEIGDALCILTSVRHAGGANTCVTGEPDSVRTVLALGMCKGYLRQEENQYLANDIEKVKKLPIRAQALAGYALSRPNHGWVNLKSPLNLLGRDVPETNDDFWDPDQKELA